MKRQYRAQFDDFIDDDAISRLGYQIAPDAFACADESLYGDSTMMLHYAMRRCARRVGMLMRRFMMARAGLRRFTGRALMRWPSTAFGTHQFLDAVSTG